MFMCQLNTMTTLHKILLCGTLAMALKPALAQSTDQSAPPASTNVPETPKFASGASSSVGTGVCIHAENPRFPPEVRKKNARGEILLHATITTDGSVKDVTVTSGDPTLTGSAVEAV